MYVQNSSLLILLMNSANKKLSPTKYNQKLREIHIPHR